MMVNQLTVQAGVTPHENDSDLDELTALRDRMRAVLAKWRRIPNRVPRGAEICRLLEAGG
jgi:hypothetical protein